ncbi:NAD(P)-dependent oxidoreductase [Microbacterium sp. PRC9]|uniref:NAD-dependent epimerase/dehydratase family protein n=1 Tax=Microbacterium sp. PRC9 TaxID=2962591 RepID=UPI002880FA7E|nr:NAD(P)-dependent oxidoreductase [Microbacterium sp. PRC9]MDT0141099.1 NAD(P)-dependent oxidoreductase [Microbacterium sp. PRC9]
MSARPKVVVTGAGGYIGPHVVRGLLERDMDVVAVVRPGNTTQLDPRAERLEADILAPGFDPAVLADAAPRLVHLAWKDGFTHNSPAHMGQVSGHYSLLNALAERGVRRIVALGTMHEVGYWEGAVDEDTPTKPLSLYGVAKDALRKALPLSLPEMTSLAWARCYYIYGDDRRNRSIFARLLEAVDEGRETLPFTTGKNKYDFIRVEELGRQLAALTAAEEVHGVVNCSTGLPVSLAEKVEEFIAENELPIRLEYGAFPDRPYDSPATWGNATRINAVLAAHPS